VVCADAPYPGTDPGGFSAGLFATRGGSHSNDPSPYYLRAANRAAAVPTEMSSVIGFRVAADAAAAGTLAGQQPAATVTRSSQAPASVPVPPHGQLPKEIGRETPVWQGQPRASLSLSAHFH
jgi:hypothetical protein